MLYRPALHCHTTTNLSYSYFPLVWVSIVINIDFGYFSYMSIFICLCAAATIQLNFNLSCLSSKQGYLGGNFCLAVTEMSHPVLHRWVALSGVVFWQLRSESAARDFCSSPRRPFQFRRWSGETLIWILYVPVDGWVEVWPGGLTLLL